MQTILQALPVLTYDEIKKMASLLKSALLSLIEENSYLSTNRTIIIKEQCQLIIKQVDLHEEKCHLFDRNLYKTLEKAILPSLPLASASDRQLLWREIRSKELPKMWMELTDNLQLETDIDAILKQMVND